MSPTERPLPSPSPVRVLLWHAHEDRDDCDALCKHLAAAERAGVLLVWHERRVQPGADLAGPRATEWGRAEIVVVLASADFIAQRYDDAEVLRRAVRSGKPVFPVLVQPCDLSLTRLAGQQVLPRDGSDLGGLDRNARERAWSAIGAEIIAYARRLREAPALVGRAMEREEILHAVDRGEPTQLLGLPRMGKTALLRWAAETLRTMGKPVVYLNARGLAFSSGPQLVRAVAESLGKLAEVEAALGGRSALPSAREAAEVLPMLAPSCWLVDDADALAVSGHAFDKTFFDMLRALGQKQDVNERILWISASETDLYGRFHATGLTSQFLNHARKVPVGALRRQDVLDWVGRLGFPGGEAEKVWRLSGGCPPAVEWVIERRAQMRGDEGALAASLGDWMRALYERWWEMLEEEERQLLSTARGEGRAMKEGSAREDTGVEERLRDRGLVVEGTSGIEPAGMVWRRFVDGT